MRSGEHGFLPIAVRMARVGRNHMYTCTVYVQHFEQGNQQYTAMYSVHIRFWPTLGMAYGMSCIQTRFICRLDYSKLLRMGELPISCCTTSCFINGREMCSFLETHMNVYKHTQAHVTNIQTCTHAHTNHSCTTRRFMTCWPQSK